MNRNKNTFPGIEDPLGYAVFLSASISEKKQPSEKQRLGQYFTPARLAEYTVNIEKDFLNTMSGTVRILDPGTGTGILSCALIQKLSENKGVKKVELACYEIDSRTAECARLSFDSLEKWLREKGISFNCSFNNGDFISEHSSVINSFPETLPNSSEKYDIIISNPPFYKLGSGHPYIASASFNFRYHLNIYHLFLFVSANILKDSGRMLFIIPSAFFSGGYFAELRKIILNIISVEKVLFFRSPAEIFERDSLLSDTAVISFSLNKSGSSEKPVSITAYDNYLADRNFEYSYNYNAEINQLPFLTSASEMHLFNKVDGWPSTVAESGYCINAGDILYSEASSAFTSSEKNESVRILYLFLNKILDHKNVRPEKYIYSSEQMFCSENIPGHLLQAGNLVLIRRYNSADSIPVQSSPFFLNNFDTEHLAIDKRLLYLYKPGCNMPDAEALGLSLVLNSRLMRKYIWITYGKINLTIQEFLDLPLPSENIVMRAGKLFLPSFFHRIAEK